MNEMDDLLLKKDANFVKYRGISQSKSGRWQVRIRNPIMKKQIWVGTYSSIKEANDAYSKEKLEFESMAPSCKKEEPSKVAGKLPGSVYRVRKSNGGWKWRAEIRSKEVRIYVGVYATPEEARRALDRKRRELDPMADNQMKEIQQSEVNVEEKISDVLGQSEVHVEEKMSDVKGQSEVHVEEKMSEVKERPTGVFRRKSGRWFAEIRNPITKVRGSVGTYETAEEAAEALRRKKEEFGLMVKDASVVAESKEGEPTSRKRSKSDGNCRGNPHDVYQGKLEVWCADMRDVIAKTKSSGEIDDGKNVRVANEDLYVGVIDGYGRLIGEFSRIDDELWLCRSLDDDDDPFRIQ